MMIRAYRSLESARSLRTHYQHQVFRHAVGLFFRLLLSSADLDGTLLQSFVVVAVEKWKAFCASQAQLLFHGHIRLRLSAAADVDNLCRWTTRPRRCEPVCWRLRPLLCYVVPAGQAGAPTARNLRCHT